MTLPTSHLLIVLKGMLSWDERGVWSVTKKPIVLFERHCHATEKSEAIACARSCWSSCLTRWWTQKE
jgi:hypothetical protein